MEVLSKLISMILVVILITLFPLQYILGHQLTLFDEYVETETIKLIDNIKEKKYVDLDMYESFQEKLNLTGLLYDIEMEHAVPKEGKDITSLEDIPGVLVVSSELNSLPSTSDTESSVTYEDRDIHLLALHTHTGDCYSGHRHIGACYSRISLPTGFVMFTRLKTFYGSPQMAFNDYYLQIGGSSSSEVIEIFDYSYYGGYSGTQNKDIIRFRGPYHEAMYSEGDAKYQSIYNGVMELIAQVNGLVGECPLGDWNYESGTLNDAGINIESCGQTQDENSICNQVVSSITATNPTQSVDKGQSIITTATANYLDGHTGIVNCSSNFDANIAGVQTVTLTYNGLVGNALTTGTRTCSVSATVKDTNIPSLLSVVPSSTSVYNGEEPTYTVTVTYASGTSKIIYSGYTKTGWSSGVGVKTLTFAYTENGKTVTTSINITVKPKITGITVTPTLQTVERYKDPSVVVKAFYEDGSTITVYGYTLSGFDNNVIGVQDVTVQYAEGGIIKTAPLTITVTPMKRTCAVCGNEYELDTNDFDQGCPSCEKTVHSIQVSPDSLTINKNGTLQITVTATFLDGHTETVTGWNSNFESGITGYQRVLVTYLGKYEYIQVIVLSAKHCSTCNLEYTLNEDGTDPGCPYCSVQLVSISASPLTQNIKVGEIPDYSVIGEYKDGHKEEIAGWTSNFDERILGEQEVTVYYNKLSCKVKVTIISEEQIQCGVCDTVYNLMEYRWGCPICIATIVGVEAVLKTGGSRAVFGKALDLRVVITYRDRHKEIAFEGWKDNFNPFLVGAQTVTVSYTDIYKNTVSCSLYVEVVEQLAEKICENGHVYYEEDSKSGCPYCDTNTSEEAENLFFCTYTDVILDKLYTNGIYYLSDGDCISIKVTRNAKGSIYSFNIIGKREETKTLCYGGEVN